MDELALWIALSDSPLPVETVVKYFGEFGSVQGLWTSKANSLMEFGVPSKVAEQFLKYRTSQKVRDSERVLLQSAKEGASVVRYIDREYPEQLRLIEGRPPKAPPLVLFRKGVLLHGGRSVAIVGTRRCSEAGVGMASEIASTLARGGHTIVSGLARGIDTAAHRGALESGGRTVAVLAWMSPIYPPENKPLAEEIIKNGQLLAERYNVPPGTDSRHMFVHRNRITSGISDAIIIIESTNMGGTVWQFDFAREQRIPVFTMEPSNDQSDYRAGYDYFVGKGAIPFRTVEDLVHRLDSLQSRIDRYIPGA